GRSRGDTDDEILSALSGLLATSYSYSVSGDIYMQVMWRRLKARMEAGVIAGRLAAPGPESRVRRPSGPRPPAPEAPAPEPAPVQRSPEAAAERSPTPAKQTPRPVRAAKAPGGTPPAPRAASGPPPAGRTPANRLPGTRVRQAEANPSPPSLERAGQLHGERLLKPSPVGAEPLPEIVGRQGSISDRIRALSGKAYDVYKVIFLERVREDIRQALLANQTRSHRMFDTAANEAEDQVYAFMTAHYDDPFMDWARSAEREAVELRGFSLPSLDPVIKACYEKL
ncbi:MAG TPA: hypothetical protein VFL04_02585, partial [Rectinemataceae bacterium]|nr:hypothetical protein [Rectinemataceae bacterium]